MEEELFSRPPAPPPPRAQGHIEHEARLQAALNDPQSPPLLLWPGEGALTPDELLAADRAATAAADDDAAASEGADVPQHRRRTLIVVDGTWSGARRLMESLPASLPRVRLPAEAVGGGARSLLAPVREYTGDLGLGRVSTLEAMAALLRALGEPATADVLLDALRLKARQRGGTSAVFMPFVSFLTRGSDPQRARLAGALPPRLH